MTVTLNNCDDLQVTSTLLATFLADEESYTVTFNSTINCCDTVYTKDVEVADVTVDTISIDPTVYNSTWTEFLSGVYYLEIVLTETETGTTQTDKICFPVDCANSIWTLVCTHIAADTEMKSNADRLYRAFLLSDNCDDCECTKGCTIYEALMEELSVDLTNIKKDCGCS
jgi:hypothetical protein